uniref:Salivary yellow-related protein n=1 Tax=Sergentomyia schwetzi TaxID=114605 RepID=A0A6B9VJT8_9DIPT|nr:salivary yellow-related protein [Sergentomyia schwetzi]
MKFLVWFPIFLIFQEFQSISSNGETVQILHHWIFGDSIIKQNIPDSIAHDVKNRKLFIAIPRVFESNTMTLAEINDGSARSANFIPFSGKPTKPFISVYQVVVDECDRLWVLDAGSAYKGRYEKRNAAIIAFDLKTKKDYPEISRYEIPKEYVKEPHYFAKMAVDVVNPTEGCDKTFIYIANHLECAMIVYNHKDKTSRRITHRSFQPKRQTEITRASLKYTSGLYSITLGQRDANGDRIAYYIPGSGTELFAINTKKIKNKEAFVPTRIGDRELPEDSPLRNKNLWALSYSTGLNDAITMAYDPLTKVLFVGEPNNRRIACWKTEGEFTDENKDAIYSNNDIYLFKDMSVDAHGTLWSLVYVLEPQEWYKLSPKVIPRIQIWKADTSIAIGGTKCDAGESMYY